MKQNLLFRQAALRPATTTLSRRQLLLGGIAAAASTAAVLLAAKPLALAPTVQSSTKALPTMGAFEALNIFLNASRIQR